MNRNGTDANEAKQQAAREGRRFAPEDAEREPVEATGEGAERREAVPTFNATPRGLRTLERLREARTRRLLSIADLPERHGLVEVLDHLMGGGLKPGDFVCFSAAGAGLGKTALVMQLADGLALRSEAVARGELEGPLTPMLVVSEMSEEDLDNRTLGRLLDVSGHVFAAGASAKRFHEPGAVEAWFEHAEAQLEEGAPFDRMRRWQHLSRPEPGEWMIDQMAAKLAELVGAARARCPGREVWPVLVLDPLHRFQDPKLSEVEGLNDLARQVDKWADAEGWIVLSTADTNKEAAKAAWGELATGAAPNAASVMRGSYQLQHALDFLFTLAPGPYTEKGEPRRTGLWVGKNRRGRTDVGVELRWFAHEGLRFDSETPEEHDARARAEREEAERKRREKEAKRRGGGKAAPGTDAADAGEGAYGDDA